MEIQGWLACRNTKLKPRSTNEVICVTESKNTICYSVAKGSGALIVMNKLAIEDTEALIHPVRRLSISHTSLQWKLRSQVP